MKLSCNGCRILRKGCSEKCIIRPCLEWINSPESQANATLFLAKFYGRTALLNLINAASQHHAPAVFKSLLYEACGRLVNPTYGSLGLFWTGEWAQCEAAVDAVLTGTKINGVAAFDWVTAGTLGGSDHVPPACDTGHVARGINVDYVRGRTGLKRVGQVTKPKPRVGSADSAWLWKPAWERESVESVEASLVSQDEPNRTALDLELTLGFNCETTSGKKRRY
ncbi:LOB domain-containing protein 40-like [Abrus precatorius]|uniref:LOB domain-containing protein 40-like n=1 Tax=Abrus precatorius TaxID=3816 RepID=A0A8B8M8D9_ABRPR|nr:LOB domain-containing protein 40-like [Abrus precatorius]